MAYYSVFFVTPKTEGWIPDYLAEVGTLVAKHGGKYLARTASHERAEGAGESPGLIRLARVAIEGSFRRLLSGPGLRSAPEARLGGAENQAFIVEGKDDFA